MMSATNGKTPVNTPDMKKKGPGSVGRGSGADDPNEDAKSNASSSSSNKAQVRRTPANTQNKKPSVVSTNKPNCNVTKEAKSSKDENVPETNDVENLEVKKDETKVPKREKTPDII